MSKGKQGIITSIISNHFNEVLQNHANMLVNLRNHESELRKQLREVYAKYNKLAANFEYAVSALANQRKENEKMQIETLRDHTREEMLAHPPDEDTVEYIRLRGEIDSLQEQINDLDTQEEFYRTGTKTALLDYEMGISRKKAPIRIEMSYPD